MRTNQLCSSEDALVVPVCASGGHCVLWGGHASVGTVD